jgi:hypothetical protein
MIIGLPCFRRDGRVFWRRPCLIATAYARVVIVFAGIFPSLDHAFYSSSIKQEQTYSEEARLLRNAV